MKKCLHCGAKFLPKRKEQVYCSKSCASVKKGLARSGQKTGPQRGKVYARKKDKDGYVRVYAGLHPFANGRLMILEHVMLMELILNRRLLTTEVVHHINRDREDNRIENLELMTRKEHCRLHGEESVLMRVRGTDGRFA